MAYAVGDASNYMAYGQQKGIVSVDLATGKVTEVSAWHWRHAKTAGQLCSRQGMSKDRARVSTSSQHRLCKLL